MSDVSSFYQKVQILCVPRLCVPIVLCAPGSDPVFLTAYRDTRHVSSSLLLFRPLPRHIRPLRLASLSLSYPALTFSSRLQRDQGHRAHKASAHHERRLWRRYRFICIFSNPRLCTLLYDVVSCFKLCISF